MKMNCNIRSVRNTGYLLLVFIFLGRTTQAQEILTVEEAVRIALENNYEIKLAKNNLSIDENSVSLGYAGMLPIVEATVVDNNSIQNLSQIRSDGSLVEQPNAKNNNLNYGVGLDLVLFDGFGMFARYAQLEQMEDLGKAELNRTILERVGNVLNTYYELVQQKQELAALDSTLVISKQRVELAENRFTIGRASKLEVLNAKVDLNTDRVLLSRQTELHSNTKIRLNEILARNTKTDFTVIDAMMVDESLSLPQLEILAKERNPELIAQLINKRIAELELKRVRAARYPTIVGSTGYNFSESESSLGFTTSSSSKGFNYGFSASVNVFDGFNQKRNEKTAKIQIENTTIAIAQQSQALQAQLDIAYQTYLTNVSLIEVEGNNETIAKENLDITLEKFKIGTIPALEFRTAQLNYINSKVRFSEATYQAKLSEIFLKQLAGNLDL
jgi:outer membrane protein TolC